jgi:porin
MKIHPCLFLLLLGSKAVLAQSQTGQSWLDGEYLTGDWQGKRTELKESGVTVFGYYNAIAAANVSGGVESDSSYAGDLFVGMHVDLEKILGWDDTVLNLSAIDRHGRSIDSAVGGRYSVMQLVGGQNAFLYEVNLEKKFLDETLSIKLGRLSATDDFVGSPYYSYSLNNAVNGQIRAVLFDGVMTSYPFPVWGGRVKYQPNEEFYVTVGAYQLSDDIFDRNDQGVDLRIDGEDGVSIFTQVGWSPQIAEKPANFFVGANNAFYDMEKFNSTGTTNHFLRLYAHGDYQVYQESPGSEEGLVVFATFAYTRQEDVAIIPIQSTVGLNYQGLFPGREKDRTLLYTTFGKFSGDFSREEVAAGRGATDYEMVVELGHRFELTQFAYIQPDLQYIIHPGGTGDIDNALVAGVQFGVTF